MFKHIIKRLCLSQIFDPLIAAATKPWKHLTPSINCKPIKMEITSQNFVEKLPIIEKAIEDSIFVSIDGEFTGLVTHKDLNSLDTLEERYVKLKKSTEDFLLVQFGLCTFHYDAKKDEYTNQAFNIYVWPRQFARNAPDNKFNSLTSSIDFLCQQDFDFNKLFRYGVTYLRPDNMEKMKEALVEKHKMTKARRSLGSNETIAIPDEQKEFMDNICKQINDFLESDKSSIELPKCNAFQRRLIYSTINEKYKQIMVETAPKTKGSFHVAMKLTKASSPEDQGRLEEEKHLSDLNDLNDKNGFTRIITKLSDSGKLIVGHNMILDICHTINQFVSPIPETYREFKSLCNEKFPKILDTKVMANNSPFKEEIPVSALEECKATLSKAPYEMPDVKPTSEEYGYQNGSERYHEAGYDAYITGLCFIAMANRLGSLSMDKSTKHPSTGKARVLPGSNLLSPYLNKFHIMRSYDIPYANIAEEEAELDRSHVFHISFPSTWKTHDVKSLFQNSVGPVEISWVSDTSAFICLQIKENSSQVMKLLKTTNANYSIMPYKQYKEFTQKYTGTTSTPTSPWKKSNTGITPTLENAKINLTPGLALNAEAAKKRSASPESDTFKRSKSINEESKNQILLDVKRSPFEVPTWE